MYRTHRSRVLCVSLALCVNVSHTGMQNKVRKRSPAPALNISVKEYLMPEEQRTSNNSQTYLVSAEEFSFETIEQENGQATVVRFRLDAIRP